MHDLAPALRGLPVGLTFPEVVNEPSSDPAHWTDLQGRILNVIRGALPDNTIVLTGTDWSSLDGLLKIQPVQDRNVIYSFHTYEPTLLTLLGFWDQGIDKNALAAHIPFPTTPSACKAAQAATGQDHTARGDPVLVLQPAERGQHRGRAASRHRLGPMRTMSAS